MLATCSNHYNIHFQGKPRPIKSEYRKQVWAPKLLNIAQSILSAARIQKRAVSGMKAEKGEGAELVHWIGGEGSLKGKGGSLQ